MQNQKKEPAAGTGLRKIYDLMGSSSAIVGSTGEPIEVKIGSVKTRGGDEMTRASIAMSVNKMQCEFPGFRFYVTSKKLSTGELHIGCRPNADT